MAQKQQNKYNKYKDYISSKIDKDEEPAISVSDRGVLHVSSAYVLSTATGAKQVDASIRLKKASKDRD